METSAVKKGHQYKTIQGRESGMEYTLSMMKLLLQLRSKKQNFWKKLLKIASLRIKICCFFTAFCPTLTTYQPI